MNWTVRLRASAIPIYCPGDDFDEEMRLAMRRLPAAFNNGRAAFDYEIIEISPDDNSLTAGTQSEPVFNHIEGEDANHDFMAEFDVMIAADSQEAAGSLAIALAKVPTPTPEADEDDLYGDEDDEDDDDR